MKLNMSQQCTLEQKNKSLMLSWSVCTKHFQQVRRGDPSPLFSTGEITSGLLCPVLGSPEQERHGRTGESPTKCHEDDDGTEVF